MFSTVLQRTFWGSFTWSWSC